MLLDNFIRLSCLGLTVYKLMRCLKAMPHDFLIALAFQRRVRLTFLCRLSALSLTNSFHAEAHLIGSWRLGGGGEGVGGGHSSKFYTGSSAPRSNPLPFYILFLTEKVPLSYTVEPPLTATSLFFGGQSVNRRFLKPLYNSYFLLSKGPVIIYRLGGGGGGVGRRILGGHLIFRRPKVGISRN